MKINKWIITTLSLAIIFILLISGTIYIIDPLMYFHKPISDYGYDISNDTYQNPGIAKNFDYNSVLMGSSVTMNYSIYKIDEIFDTKTVRLSYLQAYSSNLKYILKVIFSNNNDVENIFYGVDMFSIISSYDTIENRVPEYLYDKNPFNDIKYLLNKDLFFSSLKTILNIHDKTPNTDLNDILSFREKAINKTGPANFGGENFVAQNTFEQQDMMPKDAYLENTNGVLQKNIIPYIEDNPDTTFHMFFNPNYIMYYCKLQGQGKLDAILESEKLFIKTLLEYDNVKIHYFQSDEEIILDPYKFINEKYYALEITESIVIAMKEESHILTKQNYINQVDKLKEIVMDIDTQEYYDEIQLEVERRKAQGLRY